MRKLQLPLLAITVAAVGALVLAACGGEEPTAAPAPPTATPRPAPAATPAPTAAPVATATRGTAAPTVAPRPTPTPRPAPPTPTPLSARRGGFLQLAPIANEPFGYDTYETGGAGQASHEIWQPIMNNLLWPDPYGDGHTLVGEVAERWEFTQGGNVLTFFLRKGIKFHDGTALTSKDVAYNVERALKPRSPRMTYFRGRLPGVERVETPDEFTIRLTLSAPSNALVRVLSMNQFTIYPAHLAFPEKLEEFRKQPIGSGPFKIRSVDPGIKIQYLRNDAYWKPGLPYLDGIESTPMPGPTMVAAFRAGRVDAWLFNQNAVTTSVVNSLARELGFVKLPMVIGMAPIVLNQRPPWTDQRAREAFTLSVDRPALVVTWLDGDGNPYAAPLLPPELGGQFGIPAEVMKARPGFRDNKAPDIARGKQLLAEAGINPAQVTVQIIGSDVRPAYGEVLEAGVRSLGFKTDLVTLGSVDSNARVQRGDFDVYPISSSISFDDPSDYMTPWVVTNGGFNTGKWSHPRLDQFLTEQDKTLDVALRKQMLLEVQEIMLKEAFGAFVPAVWRTGVLGHMPWVKNYYPKLPFLHSPRFRWEQVWIER